MIRLILLLRAINVGGTGKLPMADLRALCTKVGLKGVRTYIASGNVVCDSPFSLAATKAKVEKALAAKLGKPAAVIIRTADELDEVIAANPFPKAEPNRLLITFLDAAPPKDAIKGWPIPADEALALKGRELFIHFPNGMGQSKLKVPFAKEGTGRNLNSVKALLEMARDDG